MRRFWKFALVVIALLGFAFWWLMPLRVERTFLGNISPNFQSWCATDLDGDGNAEILLSYPNKPPVLVQMQGDNFETTNLLGVDNVVLPSPDNPQGLLLPLAKSVPAKAKGQFWLMRIEKGLVSLHRFPKVERPDHVVWLDADNDGKLNDLIVRSGEKRFWFTMDENGEWVFRAQLPSGPKRNLLGIADLDKDGKPEFVTGGQNYSVLWGDGKPETKLGSNLELAKVQVADLDNDGRAEIVALKHEGSFARLVVWKFEPSQKRLVSSASPQFEFYASLTVAGQKLPLDKLWVTDLNGDGLKEVVVYANDFLLADIFQALMAQSQLRILGLSSSIASPIHHFRVHPQISSTSWLLVVVGGKQVQPRQVEPMREAQQPVSCLLFHNQVLLLTEQWQYIRRFHPRFLSLNPLIVAWWEERIGKQGALWRLKDLAQTRAVLCRKVLNLPGSPHLIADFNGDGFWEILWAQEFVGTFTEQRVVGITAWKLGRWRKVAWSLTEQGQHLQVASTSTPMSHQIILLLFRLTASHSSPVRQIRLLPVKISKGFDILLASPDGAIEKVKVK